MNPEICSGPPSAMILLARLAKQGMRRANPELLGMDLRLLLLLNELEDHGYLVRRRDSEDRRRHRVLITEAGREAIGRARDHMDAIENEVLQALDTDEREALVKLLARALHGVERVDGDAGHPALTAVSS